MQPKGLLFDFDGTLYGDWRLWVSTIQETLDDFHVAVTAYEALEKARIMIGDGTFYNISGVAIAIAQEHGVHRDTDVRTRFLEKLDRIMDETGPGNEIVRTLDELRGDGFRMGLVTFQRRPRLERRLKAWTLKDYFQSIVTPEMHAEFKPSPEPFLTAMKELALPPPKCYVVGDEPVDMVGGKKAGARTVGLPQGFFSEQELRNAGADFIISSLTILPQTLR